MTKRHHHALYPTSFCTIERILGALIFALAAPSSLAWEAYEFDVAYISTVNNSCVIGISNLSPKSGGNENICDNPSEIVIDDCTTAASKIKLKLALTAKTAGNRMWHQAIAESPSSGCAVSAYNLKLQE